MLLRPKRYTNSSVSGGEVKLFLDFGFCIPDTMATSNPILVRIEV